MRLAVSVEGQTEEEFVKVVLDPHLRPFRVVPEPILIGIGVGDGGGSVSVRRLVSDMARLYYTHDAVTSLVDFYGFQKKGDRTVEVLETHLHEKIRETVGEDWNEDKVFPYIQLHEFEGLLFSDVTAFGNQIGFPEDCVDELRAVREQFEDSPEDINDNSATAPSRRILAAIPQYVKRIHGPMLAKGIGLDTIRAACPRFDGWVARLESLGTG